MIGTSLTLDLFLGGIVTILLLALLILKEFASASENPDWQRIGNLLYIPILPLMFLFFLLAGYRAFVVLGLLPEPRSEGPETSGLVAEASETVTPLAPIIVNPDPTQPSVLTATNSPAASETPLPTPTPTETDVPAETVTLPQAAPTLPAPTRIAPSPTQPQPPTNTSPPPPPTNTPPPAPTATPEPTEPEPPPEPTDTEPPPPSPVPTQPPPSPVPTPTPAPIETEETPDPLPTPTLAPPPS